MVLTLIKEIESCIKNENFLGALSLALTLPDICGKAHYPGEGPTSRYRKWYEENIGKYDDPMMSVVDDEKFKSNEVDMPYLNGEMLYSLRNSFFHQGTLNVNLNENHLDRCKVTHFTLFVDDYTHGGCAIIHSSCYYDDLQEKERILEINLVNLCWKLCLVARRYYEENREKFDFFEYDYQDRRKPGQEVLWKYGLLSD